MSPAMICSPVTPVDRARALLGTKFRLHGRDPQHGLDCVGVVAFVFGAEGAVPSGYALRGGRPDHWAALLDQFASRRIGKACAGDIVLLQAGPAQFHMGLWTGSSLIHADAGVGRVVESAGALRWPIIGAWFIEQEQ